MIIDPFPELRHNAVVHVRTDVLSESRAPFIRQTVLGLTPYFRNVVLATDFDCELPEEIVTKRMDRKEMRTRAWAYRTASEIRESVPNVIAVVGHFGNGMRVGNPLASALAVPMLGIFGGSDVNVEMIAERYRARFNALFLDADNYFLTVASYLTDKAIAQGAPLERTFPWRRGVDLSLFDAPGWPQRLRFPRPLRIVMIGRFIDVKGHEYAIRAFAEVVRDFPDIELDLFGDGPLEDSLRTLVVELGIAEKVRFRGHVTHDEVTEALRVAQICILSSVVCDEGKSEGIPNVLVEAQAMALPVVATTNGGIPETVVDEETGFLVPERDPSALAAAMKRLVADATLRAEMGEAARRHVEVNFDRETQARRLAARIGQMCGRAALRGSREPLIRQAPPAPGGSRSSRTVRAAAPKRSRADKLEFPNRKELTRLLREPLISPTSGQPGNPIVRLKLAYIQLLARFVFRPYFRSGPRLFLERLAYMFDQLMAETVRREASLDARQPVRTEPVATTTLPTTTLPTTLPSPQYVSVTIQSPQYMNVAKCESCPHCPRSAPWPALECPMDLGCLAALEEEYTRRPQPVAPSLDLPAAFNESALELTDADLPAHGRLEHASASFGAVHCCSDLQGVDDVPMLLNELRRILRQDGHLFLRVWPLYCGAGGGRLLGTLNSPFAHRFFAAEILAEHLGSPLRKARDVGPQVLDQWIGEAGLSAHHRWRPGAEQNPCALEFQSRFGARLMNLRCNVSELLYAYVAVLKPSL